MSNYLVEAKHIKKYFPIKNAFLSTQKKFVRAVDDLSFSVIKGETFGLVGESGCGKSTTGRLVLRLLGLTHGQIFFNGEEITHLTGKSLIKIRREAQMIFQDPYASLNPRMPISEIISEPFLIHGLYPNKKEREQKVFELMETVGLNPSWIMRYPHEFSGGQRQRIGIARALALRPKLIVCDEPVSALDVSIQAQVLNLMQDLQEKLNLTYLFIAHDLGVVKHLCDRIGVMYLGKIVEITDKKTLYRMPLHPYTKALLSAVPIPNPHHRNDLILLKGEIPSPASPPPGCSFHPRCPNIMDICKKEEPGVKEIEEGHTVSCHLNF